MLRADGYLDMVSENFCKNSCNFDPKGNGPEADPDHDLSCCTNGIVSTTLGLELGAMIGAGIGAGVGYILVGDYSSTPFGREAIKTCAGIGTIIGMNTGLFVGGIMFPLHYYCKNTQSDNEPGRCTKLSQFFGGLFSNTSNRNQEEDTLVLLGEHSSESDDFKGRPNPESFGMV